MVGTSSLLEKPTLYKAILFYNLQRISDIGQCFLCVLHKKCIHTNPDGF